MVVYLDTVLFYNILADDLLLVATGRISGLPLHRRRIFIAALLGGAYAAAAAIPGAAVLRVPCLKLLTAALMVRIAFGKKPRFLRRYLLFLIISAAFAGVELALCCITGTEDGLPPFSLLLFLGSFVFCWMLLGVVFRGSAAHAAAGHLTALTITRGEHSVRVTALRDSGCSLRSPENGMPVAVVELDCLECLFSPEEHRALRQQSSAAELPLTLLPFQSVGGSGILAAFRTDFLTVSGRTYEGALVAVHPGSLGGEMFHALWGGEERVS